MAGDVAGPKSFSGPLPLRSPSGAADRRPPVDRLRLATFERTLWQIGISELEATVGEMTTDRLHAWFEEDPSLLEIAVLRTCQRVLLLGVFDAPDGADRWAGRLSIAGTWTVRTDEEAIRHLYGIAAGLESRAPGEREVRDQVRAAAQGVRSHYPRPVLANLLRRAASAPERLPPSPEGSVADLAAEWLRPRLAGRRARVLVIGAGTVGRKAAQRLAGESDVTLLYRTRPPDPAWTARWNVRVRPAPEMIAALRTADAVIAAAKTQGRVLGPSDLPGPAEAGPRWFVDLGLPRNIDPDVGRRSGVQLVDLTGLPQGRVAPERLAVVRQTIRAAADQGIRDFARASVEPWVTELRVWAESVRWEEWERALAHAPDLPEPARIAFERLTERLVRRLLAGPSAELRGLPPEPAMDLLRRRVVDMFLTADPRP